MKFALLANVHDGILVLCVCASMHVSTILCDSLQGWVINASFIVHACMCDGVSIKIQFSNMQNHHIHIGQGGKRHLDKPPLLHYQQIPFNFM